MAMSVSLAFLALLVGVDAALVGVTQRPYVDDLIAISALDARPTSPGPVWPIYDAVQDAVEDHTGASLRAA